MGLRRNVLAEVRLALAVRRLDDDAIFSIGEIGNIYTIYTFCMAKKNLARFVD